MLSGMQIQVVELHENERCWVGKGFGKGGLLPNDRGAFSSADGSMSWKTLQEASDDPVFLGRGWSYKEDEFFVPVAGGQGDGWMYASDFRADAISNAKHQKGVLDWVRFRRVFRTKMFSLDQIVDKDDDTHEKCDHCDSKATETLSKLMLDVLAYCTLLHNPTHLTDAIAFPLKKIVVDLAISQPAPAGNSSDDDANVQLEFLRKALENHIEKERGDTAIRRILSGIDFSFHGRHGRAEFQKRAQTLSERYFSSEESDAIAGLIVRKTDTKYQLHCDQKRCGDSCKFAREVCPNDGCEIIMSRMYLSAHHETCPYRIVRCDCGDVFPLHEQPQHLASQCPFRDIDCPFDKIGCTKVIKACDLDKHVEDDVGAHLVMAMNRMMQYEKVMKAMNTKIAKLEGDTASLDQGLKIYHDTNQKDQQKIAADLVSTNKSLAKLEKLCQKEFKELHVGGK